MTAEQQALVDAEVARAETEFLTKGNTMAYAAVMAWLEHMVLPTIVDMVDYDMPRDVTTLRFSDGSEAYWHGDCEELTLDD